MAGSGGTTASDDSPEYSTVLRHIADINQRIPPAERSTVADKLLQAGLITPASHTNATALGTGIPHNQLISSLMAEAMARIKTCSRLFYDLISILRTVDDTFATELTIECSRLRESSVVEIADRNRQGTHLSQAPTGSSFQSNQTGANHPNLDILVCGRSGVGKSSLVNSLLGREVCRVGDPGLEVDYDSLKGCTTCTEQKSLTLENGIHIGFYDSPGLQDGNNDEKAYLDDMYSKCKDVDLFLYCMDMTDSRFQIEEADAINMITQKFGPAIWTRCVLVLTKANLVSAQAKHAKTPPALYYENMFSNKQAKFLSVLDGKAPVNLPVLAAGHHQSNEDDRYLYFASERSKPNNPQRNNDGRVDFIAELWVTCLETIPESSRFTFWQATASNGRLQQEGKEIILKVIMDATKTPTKYPSANKTPEQTGGNGDANRTTGGNGDVKRIPEQTGGLTYIPLTQQDQNGDVPTSKINLTPNQVERTQEAIKTYNYVTAAIGGAAAGLTGAIFGPAAGPVIVVVVSPNN